MVELGEVSRAKGDTSLPDTVPSRYHKGFEHLGGTTKGLNSIPVNRPVYSVVHFTHQAGDRHGALALSPCRRPPTGGR